MVEIENVACLWRLDANLTSHCAQIHVGTGQLGSRLFFFFLTYNRSRTKLSLKAHFGEMLHVLKMNGVFK